MFKSNEIGMYLKPSTFFISYCQLSHLYLQFRNKAFHFGEMCQNGRF